MSCHSASFIRTIPSVSELHRFSRTKRVADFDRRWRLSLRPETDKLLTPQRLIYYITYFRFCQEKIRFFGEKSASQKHIGSENAVLSLPTEAPVISFAYLRDNSRAVTVKARIVL